jgi:uncharacterized protein YggE
MSACFNDGKRYSVSTVEVSGTGMASAKPDVVYFSINFEVVADTTQNAKDGLDKKIQQVLSVLKDSGIKDNNIRTTSLAYEVANEFNGTRWVKQGQKARQTMNITIDDILVNTEALPTLLDKIVVIDEVIVDNINFAVKNNTELFAKSRELAFNKALDKAKQYAALNGLKIKKVLTITENPQAAFYGVRNAAMNAKSNDMFTATDSADSGAAVPTGEIDISTELAVTFLMK